MAVPMAGKTGCEELYVTTLLHRPRAEGSQEQIIQADWSPSQIRYPLAHKSAKLGDPSPLRPCDQFTMFCFLQDVAYELLLVLAIVLVPKA
jgi:hypothetical protein